MTTFLTSRTQKKIQKLPYFYFLLLLIRMWVSFGKKSSHTHYFPKLGSHYHSRKEKKRKQQIDSLSFLVVVSLPRHKIQKLVCNMQTGLHSFWGGGEMSCGVVFYSHVVEAKPFPQIGWFSRKNICIIYSLIVIFIENGKNRLCVCTSAENS